ncbi:LapA family protein [Pseudomonas sp. K2I15]|uniref:LapA family protein n=1 Tax=unclassified Pseudomonas TaxID=196821 RepID=UPI000B4C7DFB|nr:LapA family protein [Pseudomonas sp. K2I15]OWP68490.1 hypothetical protein CEC48_27905 [Pseudomonas sp. K2I15]
MRNIRSVLLVIFAVLLILVTLTFVLENQESVSLTFLGWSGPELPVSVFIVAALLIGMVIGPAFSWFLSRTSRASHNRHM